MSFSLGKIEFLSVKKRVKQFIPWHCYNQKFQVWITTSCSIEFHVVVIIVTLVWPLNQELRQSKTINMLHLGNQKWTIEPFKFKLASAKVKKGLRELTSSPDVLINLPSLWLWPVNFWTLISVFLRRKGLDKVLF